MTKWKGLNSAQKKLTRLRSGADKQLDDGLENFASIAESGVIANAIFVKGYSTGHLRRSIYSGRLNGGFIIASPAEYSGYVENGTRYMDAQPFFFRTIEALVERDLGRVIMKR